MSFSGTFDYTLDAKNRLTVPARMRSSLTDSVVLARGTDDCVAIWPQRAFQAFVDATLDGLGPLDKRRDALRRFFFSNSFETELDSAGRVMVPPALIEFGGFTKDVVVNGSDDRIEVWEPLRWTAYNDALDINDLATLLADTPGA